MRLRYSPAVTVIRQSAGSDAGGGGDVGEQEFLDRIIGGFESMRERPNLNIVAQQFAAGELSFIVDRRGIRVAFEDDSEDVEPGSLI
jgi:hypothetical protein